MVEVLKQLDSSPLDERAAAAIDAVLGERDVATSAEEIARAFRKLLEQQAPLIVVFDDIQWGEETFLDLIEHRVSSLNGNQAIRHPSVSAWSRTAWGASSTALFRPSRQ